jgi:hypothetical protein
MTGKIIEILVMEGIAILLFVLRRLIARTCLLTGIGSALMPLLTHIAAGYDDGMAHAIGAYGGFIVGIIGMVMLQARDYTE